MLHCVLPNAGTMCSIPGQGTKIHMHMAWPKKKNPQQVNINNVGLCGDEGGRKRESKTGRGGWGVDGQRERESEWMNKIAHQMLMV